MNKSTLFVWDGIIEGSKDGTVVWYGTIVPIKSANAQKVEAPVRGPFDEFCKSDLQFRITGKAEPAEKSGSDPAAGGDGFQPHIIKFTGGDGWKWHGKNHVDDEFEMLSRLRWLGYVDKRNSLVFARGQDAYGPFISVGWMLPGNRITLARRYLSSQDPRVKWSIDEIKEATMKEIYNEENKSLTLPPWQCQAFNSSNNGSIFSLMCCGRFG